MSKVKIKKDTQSLIDLYLPVSCTLCQDVMMELNGNVSILRILDFVQMPLPSRIGMFLVCDFAYNPQLKREFYAGKDVTFEVELVNPKGEHFPLVRTTPNPPEEERPMVFSRLLFDLGGAVEFVNSGTYVFQVYGRIGKSDRERVMIRPFCIQQLKLESDQGQPLLSQ
jgi:hypothetical protein